MNPSASNDIQIVCVSHRPEIFERHLGASTAIAGHKIVVVDNSIENVPIPTRYNAFIENKMGEGWVIFAHHDMEFYEDPAPILSNLSRAHIYGTTGVRQDSRHRYLQVYRKSRFKLKVERGFMTRPTYYGRVKVDRSFDRSGFFGETLREVVDVDTVDCYCIIVHSSLLKRGLRFDSNFAWHFYAEDFSLNALQEFGVHTKAVQIDCGHFGEARRNDDFYRTKVDLIHKYNGREFAATCLDGWRAPREFVERRGLLIVL